MLVSIVTACFNEEDNVLELINRVRTVMSGLNEFEYEHIFIDNASTDATVELLKKEAAIDQRIKIIVNSRNFGHVRSPSFALLEANGDVVISLVADLQDPPELIPEFISKWKEGYDLVLAVKTGSDESGWMFKIRELYYSILDRLSDIRIFKNFTGFGLFDRKVMDALRLMKDPYPFFRGMLAEAGFNVYEMPYLQPTRFKGITKNNFYSLYDMGILGIINNSRVPLRLAIFLGLIGSSISFLIGIFYLIYKFIYWDDFLLGLAPLVIFLSFMFSILLVFLGLIGEYIGAIYTQVINRPLVFVKERINFD